MSGQASLHCANDGVNILIFQWVEVFTGRYAGLRTWLLYSNWQSYEFSGRTLPKLSKSCLTPHWGVITIRTLFSPDTGKAAKRP